jgi:glutamate-1-semialdehyde 2,1-aminomutase
MAAGIAALDELQHSNAYNILEGRGQQLETGMREAARDAKVDVQFVRIGSMFCAYFTSAPVHNLADAMKSDRARFAKFFHAMLAEGVYLAPSQFEAGFLSTAHTESDINRTISASAKAMRTL